MNVSTIYGVSQINQVYADAEKKSILSIQMLVSMPFLIHASEIVRFTKSFYGIILHACCTVATFILILLNYSAVMIKIDYESAHKTAADKNSFTKL